MSDAAKPLDDIATVVANWRAARAKEAEWKKAKEELAAAIAKHLDGAEIGTLNGAPALTLKTIKETRLNQQLLQKLYPDVFAECCEVKEKSTGLRTA